MVLKVHFVLNDTSERPEFNSIWHLWRDLKMALQDVQRRMVEYSQIIPKMAVIHVRGASDLRGIILFSVQYFS